MVLEHSATRRKLKGMGHLFGLIYLVTNKQLLLLKNPPRRLLCMNLKKYLLTSATATYTASATNATYSLTLLV